jgi:hypothetical protein
MYMKSQCADWGDIGYVSQLLRQHLLRRRKASSSSGGGGGGDGGSGGGCGATAAAAARNPPNGNGSSSGATDSTETGTLPAASASASMVAASSALAADADISSLPSAHEIPAAAAAPATASPLAALRVLFGDASAAEPAITTPVAMANTTVAKSGDTSTITAAASTTASSTTWDAQLQAMEDRLRRHYESPGVQQLLGHPWILENFPVARDLQLMVATFFSRLMDMLAVRQGVRAVSSLAPSLLGDKDSAQLQAARAAWAETHRARPLRVGFVSADFRQKATLYLCVTPMSHMFDQTVPATDGDACAVVPDPATGRTTELFVFATSPDFSLGSPWRAELQAAAGEDHFVELGHLADNPAVRLLSRALVLYLPRALLHSLTRRTPSLRPRASMTSLSLSLASSVCVVCVPVALWLGWQAMARAIRARDIDVLIDMDGYSNEGIAVRTLFSTRLAPVTTSWFVYMGTTGQQHIDFIVADEHVLPPHVAAQHSERVLSLPAPFFPIAHAALFDDVTQLDSETVKNHWRAKYDLPLLRAAGSPSVVFASFNKHLKITPHVWACWMEVLRAVPSSVLLLLENPRDSVPNLRAQFAAAGLAPERLQFCPFVETAEEHIFRVAMVDVILDTPPWGAHTGAADALWCAVPLVTTAAPKLAAAPHDDDASSASSASAQPPLLDSMASRVALALNACAGVPELNGEDLAEYTVSGVHGCMERSKSAFVAVAREYERALEA